MMNYSKGKGQFENWIVSETRFSSDALGKCEAALALGNGYLGLRSAAEESYVGEKRNLFVSGTFNRAAENEVTELPNLADFTKMNIRIDGERFSLELGAAKEYSRQLNLKTAELSRDFEWQSPQGKKLRFQFKRFVSLDNLHLTAMKMTIQNLAGPVRISVDSGIDAQATNSGAQHFLEGERRVFDKRYIQLMQRTIESGIDVAVNAVHNIKVNGEEVSGEPDMDMQRRKVWLGYDFMLEPQATLEVEKLATVYTSRDKEFNTPHYDIQQLRERSLQDLKACADSGYASLFEVHRNTWQERVWDTYNLNIESDIPFDELALRFAIYHLTIMTPAHDERMGIAAKGLSGEGYKGHSFWDTEIFILPFFIYSNPAVAKSLLMYRYNGLSGAQKKAKENGYQGAMYPWEMAWPTDGEVTPVWGDIDIVTGARSKIWSGFIEQHISADIAFAVHQYVEVTGDQQFLEQFGYEMVFATADFWASRLEWDEAKMQYEITNVIGPDEYKEHVDNNAFTNYMAYFNLKLAMRYFEQLKEQKNALLKLPATEQNYQQWKSRAEKLYLPKPRAHDSVIPQDDTYLDLVEVDLAKYRKQQTPRTIYRDFNAEQINGIQVSKQADTLVLLYLMEQTFLQTDKRFQESVKRANFLYYEPRTLHDSSLSLATHAILANDLGYSDLAYSLFKQASEIDLGPKMDSSDDGIHAASIGGIWKSAVFGFAGVRLVNGNLRINPKLPKHWSRMKFTIYWRGQAVHLDITQQALVIQTKGPIVLEVNGERIRCVDSMNIPLF